MFPGQRGWVFVRPWRFHRQHVWNGAPIGSGLGPTQYKRGLGVRVCAGACKSSLCPCGDQPVPPAGDRAVTSRLSEPPRMPKPARCGRRRLICNRRVLPRCRRCGRTTTSYDGLRLCARRAELRAALHVRGIARLRSIRLALRVVFNRVALFDLGFGCTAAQGNEQCENRWPSCSHERTENQLRIPPSNIVSPKHRWSHRRAGRLRGVAWRGIDRPNLCLPNVFPAPIFGKIKTHVTVISIRFYWRPRQEGQKPIKSRLSAD